MDIVRQTDLPDLFSSLGYQVKPKGSYHTLAEMPHIMIKQRVSYYNNYDQAWGDGITFLRSEHNMDFEEAVPYLLSFNGYAKDRPAPAKPPLRSSQPAEQKPAPEFVLPEPNGDNRRVFAYLLKRGISRQVIADFIRTGLLYECKEYHNCVFVGRDADGKAVFAYKRGTYDKGGNGYKGDVPGSDKNIAFRLPADPQTDAVRVFESPVDLMSYMTLYPGVNSNAVALCCLHAGALERYLGENPNIKNIVLCLDADKWGKEAAGRITEKYQAAGFAVTSKLPPKGKDWNEYLQSKKSKQIAR